MAPTPPPHFTTVGVSVDPGTHVGTLRLSRGSKSNAIDATMWVEIPQAVAGPTQSTFWLHLNHFMGLSCGVVCVGDQLQNSGQTPQINGSG